MSDPITPSTYIETIPPRYQSAYREATEGSRTSAIKAMCQHCMGYSEGCVDSIRECPSTWCPLWKVRPYQIKAQEDRRQMTPETLQARQEALRRAREARARNRAGTIRTEHGTLPVPAGDVEWSEEEQEEMIELEQEES